VSVYKVLFSQFLLFICRIDFCQFYQKTGRQSEFSLILYCFLQFFRNSVAARHSYSCVYKIFVPSFLPENGNHYRRHHPNIVGNGAPKHFLREVGFALPVAAEHVKLTFVIRDNNFHAASPFL
jgi:hypothetical protein